MTQEEYRTAAEDVIYLASCMVNESIPDTDRVAGMNLQRLYETANRHSLEGLIGYALEATGIRDSAFIQAKARAIRKDILYDMERAAVLAELEKAGIWYMPLKGSVLKSLYPKIGMRQMGDNDILFDGSKAAEVKTIMEKLGFSFGYNSAHVHFFKPPALNFEMHRFLFANIHNEDLAAYYKDVKERLILNDGSSYGYHFSTEDFYIFIIAHEYKHYSKGGTGLRSLLDTYVYLRSVPLNMAYVAAETEKMGIREFESANRSLALHLFGGEPLTEEEREMLDYIILSGTYGIKANIIRREIKEKGRLGYVRSRMTLPLSVMKKLYPILVKAPMLYPFCWAHRLIHAFFFRHKAFMFQVRTVLKKENMQSEIKGSEKRKSEKRNKEKRGL